MKSLKSNIALTVILTLVFGPIGSYANPSGENVTSGAATFDRTIANTLTVNQGTDKLITNWHDFSIAAHEVTRFNQPSSSSVALNRVVGASPSDIFGTLSANGKVFLINQNGILFAPGSQVNVAGLVASSLDIKDSDFLAGTYTFFGKGGEVVSKGHISVPGGYVVLLGATVENNGDYGGIIEANLGTVVLASGEAITLSLDPLDMISVVIDQATSQNLVDKDAAIKNTGRIFAKGGKVILTAKSLDGVFKQAINNGGSITATTFSSHDGVIELLADGAEAFNSGNIGATKLEAQAKNTDFKNQGSIVAQESINLAADGDIKLSGGSLVVNSSAGGNINLDGQSVNIGGVVLASSGDVTIKARDQIRNLWGPYAMNIVAKNIDLLAVNGIGMLDSLNMDVDNLTAVNSTSGKINILVTKGFNAKSVVNNGGAVGDDIILKTTQGEVKNIEVGTITAKGSGDVILDAAGDITDNNADSMITANNFNFTSGNVVETQAAASLKIVDGHVVLNIQNQSNNASYNVYSRATLSDPWQLVASDLAASGEETTQWIDSTTEGSSGFYKVEIASAAGSGAGSSTNRINTLVNNISGITKNAGDIYLNQAKAVTLSNLHANNGSIDVNAAGSIDALDVSTSGKAGDSISLKTTLGDIEVGKINASGGLGDVSLISASNITDHNSDSLITANSFNFRSGNVVGTQAAASLKIVDGYVVLNIENQSNNALYNVYGRTTLSDPWQLVASNLMASGEATTQWTDTTTEGSSGFYKVEIIRATGSGVGSSTNRINTDVNNIDGISKAGTGDIYLNQAKAVTLSNLHANNGSIDVNAAGSIDALDVSTSGKAGDSIIVMTAFGDINVSKINASGDMFLDSVNGSILSINGESDLISAGDTHLHAGNLIGSWDPYIPLNVNVGKDLYLAIDQRDGLADGSVGTMPVSGSLEGSVKGAYHFIPGTKEPYNFANNSFKGNPPGYIFLSKIEIWPNLSLLTPGEVVVNKTSFASQITNTLQPNQRAYYEILNPHMFRKVEMAEPTTIYAYHSLVETDNSAFDNIKLDSDVYDYIDGNMNLGRSWSLLQTEDQEKKK